jgi:hypothetical protein
MLLKNSLVFIFAIFISATSHAESSENSFGVNLGIGLPFLGQVGANYTFNDQFRISAVYNILDLSIDEASAKLTMPEVFVTYHPFSGSFFLGAGMGHEKLEVTATENGGTNQVRAEVTATTAIAKLGWMWGAQEKGFWFGVDLAYIIPMNAKNELTAPGVPTTDPNYQDVVEAMDDFGDTAYFNITFARLGYIF